MNNSTYFPQVFNWYDHREIARTYCAMGLAVYRVASHSKRPLEKGWNDGPPMADAEVCARFEELDNIGVRLGGVSGGLIDVDLDLPEAIALAPNYLPSTDACFGRPSKRRSHWLYRAVSPIRSKAFLLDAGSAEKLTIVEIRSDSGPDGWYRRHHELSARLSAIDRRPVQVAGGG